MTSRLYDREQLRKVLLLALAWELKQQLPEIALLYREVLQCRDILTGSYSLAK
jgi:hypothetical protein